jgi:ribosomal protein S8
MVKTSVLNDCLNAINNAEKAGKRQVMIRPSSKVIVKFLTVMQRHGTSQSYAHIALSILSYSPLSSYLPTSPPPSG